MQKEQADKLRVILGKNLAATRKGLRYTQAQGAKLIGCDENLLSQWETGGSVQDSVSGITLTDSEDITSWPHSTLKTHSSNFNRASH